MAGWFRVFLLQEDGPEPFRIMECLQSLIPEVKGKFRTDEDGWFQLILSHSSVGELILDHFLTSEKGVRAEINTWAALAEGFVHMDGVGFLEPDGTILIEDEDAIRADLK